MAKKRPGEWTFDEARDVAVERLRLLRDFADSSTRLWNDPSWRAWKATLEGLIERVAAAEEPVLEERGVRIPWEFAQQLIEGSDPHRERLRSFWNLMEEVGEIESRGDGIGGYEPRRLILEHADRMSEADDVARGVVNAARGSENATAEVAALLLAHQVRVESIEYPIRKTIEETIETYDLGTRYDPCEMCSVEEKVEKGNEWRTDVRAIRDAVGHAHFRVDADDDPWSVHFENTGHGYDFARSYQRGEFHAFFDSHTILYKIQLQLVTVTELLPILATNLHRGDGG